MVYRDKIVLLLSTYYISKFDNLNDPRYLELVQILTQFKVDKILTDFSTSAARIATNGEGYRNLNVDNIKT